jgi:hypothetical protein
MLFVGDETRILELNIQSVFGHTRDANRSIAERKAKEAVADTKRLEKEYKRLYGHTPHLEICRRAKY